MRIATRVIPFAFMLSLFFVVQAGFAQNPATNVDPEAAAIIAAGRVTFARTSPFSLNSSRSMSASGISELELIFPANATTSRALFTLRDDLLASDTAESVAGMDSFANRGTGAGAQNSNSDSDSGGRQGEDPDDRENRRNRVGGNIFGLDTVPTFFGAFATRGTVYPYAIMGNHPLRGGRTVIPTKITTVSLRLLNEDGSLNVFMPYQPFEDLTLDSPNFAVTNYTSGRHIQFGDAVQRAEFFNDMEDDWHTILAPKIVDRITLSVPYVVKVNFQDGSSKLVRAYYLSHAPDGTPTVLMLDLLFVVLNNNAVVSEILANKFTTNSLNTAVYPNTYLFSIDNQGQPSDCCVLGFHTYYSDAGVTLQSRWIFEFASWMSPDVFSGGFADITPLSHEISESLNDPFVNNRTPVWQFPNVPPDALICQDNLETGDPIEFLDNATVPISIRGRHGVFTYHPQTEALIPWFTQGATSDAIGGAFSYPDTTALTHSALPCPARP